MVQAVMPSLFRTILSSGMAAGIAVACSSSGAFPWEPPPGKEEALARALGRVPQRLRAIRALRAMRSPGEDRAGFLNRDSSAVSATRYAVSLPFSEGLARVVETGQIPCHYTIPEADEYDPCVNFLGMMAPREAERRWYTRDCRWTVIDTSGERQFGGRLFDGILPFHEGLAGVLSSAFFGLYQRWGFMDRSGKIVIPFEYEAVFSFSDGLARVWRPDWYGYIDTAGVRRFEVPRGYGASSFHEGLAVVRKDYEGYRYIDKSGRFAFSEAFDRASEFHEGVAHVRLRGDTGGAYIDRTGRRVFEYR